jgi:hypothetical protein
MKRLNIFTLSVIGLLSFSSIQTILAQNNTTNSSAKYAEITFDKTTYNFGVFDVKNGMKSCYFVFKNTGNKDLQILNAIASCGCTDPVFPTKTIAPGAKDSIKVTYDGTTRRPGVFRKVITVTTNAKVNNAYLYITGEMVDGTSTSRIAD